MKKHQVKPVLAVLYVVFAAAVFLFLYGRIGGCYDYTFNFSLDTESGKIDPDSINIDPSSADGYSGIFASSTVAILNQGAYTLTVEYDATQDQSLLVQAGRELTFSILLPASQTHAEETFVLESKSDTLKLRLSYSGVGHLSVRSVSLSSPRLLYTDYIYFLFLWGVFQVLLFFLYVKRKQLFSDRQTNLVYLTLAAAFLILCIPVYRSYANMGVDLRAHLMRIEGIRDGLMERQFPVIINDNYNRGFGQLACLYPNAFLYLPAGLRVLGVSLLTSYNTLVVLENFCCILFMYLASKSIHGSGPAACLSAVIYGFLPNFLYVVYPAGQVGGIGLAMLFFPVFLAGLYHVTAGKKEYWCLLTLGLTCVWECNVISTLLICVTALVIYTFFTGRPFAGNACGPC